MKPLSDYLQADRIIFLKANDRDEALMGLVHQLKKTSAISNSDTFYQAILDREKLVSTGIGMGVALPHAKMDSLESFFICLGILTKGVEWKAIDQAPVRLVFMIGGPDDKQTEYLQILSHITQFIKNEDVRKKLLTLNSEEAILQLLQKYPH